MYPSILFHARRGREAHRSPVALERETKSLTQFCQDIGADPSALSIFFSAGPVQLIQAHWATGPDARLEALELLQYVEGTGDFANTCTLAVQGDGAAELRVLTQLAVRHGLDNEPFNWVADLADNWCDLVESTHVETVADFPFLRAPFLRFFQASRLIPDGAKTDDWRFLELLGQRVFEPKAFAILRTNDDHYLRADRLGAELAPQLSTQSHPASTPGSFR